MTQQLYALWMDAGYRIGLGPTLPAEYEYGRDDIPAQEVLKHLHSLPEQAVLFDREDMSFAPLLHLLDA